MAQKYLAPLSQSYYRKGMLNVFRLISKGSGGAKNVINLWGFLIAEDGYSKEFLAQGKRVSCRPSQATIDAMCIFSASLTQI